jgi:hypothetical protein
MLRCPARGARGGSAIALLLLNELVEGLDQVVFLRVGLPEAALVVQFEVPYQLLQLLVPDGSGVRVLVGGEQVGIFEVDAKQLEVLLALQVLQVFLNVL